MTDELKAAIENFGPKKYTLKIDEEYQYTDGVPATILVADGPWPDGERRSSMIVSNEDHHRIVASLTRALEKAIEQRDRAIGSCMISATTGEKYQAEFNADLIAALKGES